MYQIRINISQTGTKEFVPYRKLDNLPEVKKMIKNLTKAKFDFEVLENGVLMPKE